MFRKKANIKYEISIKEYPKIITPAKNKIPEWYKNIPRWKNNKVSSIETGNNKTVKSCVPFLESLSTGYIITLPYDLYIEEQNGVPFLMWSSSTAPSPGLRQEPADKNLIPIGHHPFEYLWNISTSLQVPVGHSMLITHPLNRYDLPFTTLSGVIDGGYATAPHSAYPFYIKSGFNGLIKQGTPIMQIIPFKQMSWELEEKEGLSKTGNENDFKSSLLFSGWYKKNFWTRKDYS